MVHCDGHAGNRGVPAFENVRRRLRYITHEKRGRVRQFSVRSSDDQELTQKGANNAYAHEFWSRHCQDAGSRVAAAQYPDAAILYLTAGRYLEIILFQVCRVRTGGWCHGEAHKACG